MREPWERRYRGRVEYDYGIWHIDHDSLKFLEEWLRLYPLGKVLALHATVLGRDLMDRDTGEVLMRDGCRVGETPRPAIVAKSHTPWKAKPRCPTCNRQMWAGFRMVHYPEGGWECVRCALPHIEPLLIEERWSP